MTKQDLRARQEKLALTLDKLPEETDIKYAVLNEETGAGPTVFIRLRRGIRAAAAALGAPEVRSIDAGTYITLLFRADGVTVEQDVAE